MAVGDTPDTREKHSEHVQCSGSWLEPKDKAASYGETDNKKDSYLPPKDRERGCVAVKCHIKNIATCACPVEP